MNVPFPHKYAVSLSWKGGARGVLDAAPRPGVEVGPPPEFGGEDAWWSPEHLLLASANSCLMGTFMALAKLSRFEALTYESRAEGTLEKTPDGIVFTEIRIRVRLEVPRGEEARGNSLLEKAKRYCIVSNSLRKPVVLDVEIAVGA